MTFLQCFTGSAPLPPVGDDVAYDLGRVADDVVDPTITSDDNAQYSPTGATPVLSLLVTNPLADPMIALITYRVPNIRLNDTTNYAGWIGNARAVLLAIDGVIQFFNNPVEQFFDNGLGSLNANLTEVMGTYRVELAGGASVTAQLVDLVEITSDAVSPPATVTMTTDTFGVDDAYFIEATGWLKQP